MDIELQWVVGVVLNAERRVHSQHLLKIPMVRNDSAVLRCHTCIVVDINTALVSKEVESRENLSIYSQDCNADSTFCQSILEIAF